MAAPRGEMVEDHVDAPVRWTQNVRSGAATIEVPTGSARGDEVPVWFAPDGSRPVRCRAPQPGR